MQIAILCYAAFYNVQLSSAKKDAINHTILDLLYKANVFLNK